MGSKKGELPDKLELLREEADTLAESPFQFTFDGLMLGHSISKLKSLTEELSRSLGSRKRVNIKLLRKIDEIKHYSRVIEEQQDILIEVIGLLKEEVKRLKAPVKERHVEQPKREEPQHLIRNPPRIEKPNRKKKGLITRIIEWLSHLFSGTSKKFK